VADASPLILLDKVGHAALLTKLCDELALPDAVVREVGVKPEGERLIAELASIPHVRIEGHIPTPAELEAWDLGPGESQVLALAATRGGSRAVLDDLEARRCGRSLGIPLIGTLGVVLRAKRKALIPAARPVIAQLRAVGLFASSELVDGALRRLGE
jgi:predicted nucleic acid-binding protein